MQNNDKAVYLVIVIFALLVLAGFFLMFDKLGSLQTYIKNLELEIQLMKNQASATPLVEPQKNPEAPAREITEAPPLSQTAISIPTAIIAKIQSSPALQPQTEITLTIESVSKTSDGTVSVNIKAFTNDASGYTALEPRDYFEMISLQGENQKPLEIKGQFASIPPKSSVSGTVIFKIDPAQNTFILQVGTGGTSKFYEFNFSKKTYKETVIG